MWRQLQQLAQLMPDAEPHPHSQQVRPALQECGAAAVTGQLAVVRGGSSHGFRKLYYIYVSTVSRQGT
jgi:hypothetical protein